MKYKFIYILIIVNLVIVVSIVYLWMLWNDKLKKEITFNETPVNKKLVPKEHTRWCIVGKIVDQNGVRLNRIKIILSLSPTAKYGYRREKERMCFPGSFVWQFLRKEKCIMSFHKEGYKTLKNVELKLKEIRYYGDINSSDIRKRIPVQTFVMEKIKK